ncbi:MAG: DUF3617 domain-containing protein [Acidobacteriia bacterium]|nr:DUF3617 domain-containing protein [Terriglobia bacterium]
MKVLIGLSVLSCMAIWAADITPLNVKLGQWETTSQSQIAGLPPIPQNVLDKMSPEQRERIESRFKANQAPRALVTKTCLRKEDVEKAATFGDDDKACTRTIVTASSTRQEMRIECTRPTGKQTGTIHVEASDSEHVKGVVHMTMLLGDRSMTVNSSFESKWLGSVCTEKDSTK